MHSRSLSMGPPLALSAVLTLLLAGCGTTESSCPFVHRYTAFQAAIALTDPSSPQAIPVQPYMTTEEYGYLVTAPHPASFQWYLNSTQAVPTGVTGTLDTLGASGPIFVLPQTGTYVVMDSAVAGKLIPALIAGRGRITLTTPSGGGGEGPLQRVLGGVLKRACIA